MGSIAEHRFTNEATDDDHISDENDNALDDNDDKTLNDFLETRNDDDDDGQQQENIIDDTNNGGGGDGDDTDDDNDDYDDKDNDDDEYPDGENLLKNIKSDDQQYYELYLDSAHKIHLMWDVDYTENDILIEVHANVPLNAWIAIGFSDYGEEENGDFCILWWDNWNKAHFQVSM